MMLRDFTPMQAVYRTGTDRAATALDADQCCILVRWHDTQAIERVLPEAVETARQHGQRLGEQKKARSAR